MKSLSKFFVSGTNLQGITQWTPSELEEKNESVLFNFPNLQGEFEANFKSGSGTLNQPENTGSANRSGGINAGKEFMVMDFQNLKIAPEETINHCKRKKKPAGLVVDEVMEVSKSDKPSMPAGYESSSPSFRNIPNGLVSKESLHRRGVAVDVHTWNFTELLDSYADLNSGDGEINVIESGSQVSREELEKLREIRRNLEKEIALAKQQLEAARIEAEGTIESARETAELLLEEANNQIDHIKSEAYNTGIDLAKNDTDNAMRRLEQVIDETKIWREQILSGSEATIIAMVKQIGKKLFGNGYQLDARSVADMVERAISEASKLGNMRVYLNPQDEEMLVSLWQETEVMVNGQKIQLVPSQNIQLGGCFIEGEFGSLDSRIESQLELIEKEIDITLSNSKKESEGKK